MTVPVMVVLRAVQVAVVPVRHPAVPVAARVVVREKNVTRLAELVNNVWTVLVKSGLVQSLLVRTHNNRPERMNAGVSSDVKINVLTFHAELVKSSIMKLVPVMLIGLVPVKKEAEKRFII